MQAQMTPSRSQTYKELKAQKPEETEKTQEEVVEFVNEYMKEVGLGELR